MPQHCDPKTLPRMVASQVQAVQPAPDDETPAGAMPESAQQHGHHQTEIAPQRPMAITSERNVEIVAQKPRQRHVPAPPEFDDIAGLVRRIEIDGKIDIEQL